MRSKMRHDEIGNRMALEQILFHLEEATKFCNHLNLSGLSPLHQEEWQSRMNLCKNAIEFTKQSVRRLHEKLFFISA